MEALLDITATREALGGVSQWTVYRLAKSGELPVVKIGDRTLFRPEDIEAFVERRVRQSAVEPIGV